MVNDNTVSPPNQMEETQADDIATWFILNHTQLPMDGKAHRALSARIAALQAERDRRRAALENIARQSAETRPPHTSPAFYARRVLDALREGGE